MIQADINSGFHYPGHNFSGPGTNAISKIALGIEPVNHNDFVSANHDLDYEKAVTIADEIFADQTALSEYDTTLEGHLLSGAMRAKLYATQLLQLLGREQPLLGGKSGIIDTQDQQELNNLVDHLKKTLKDNPAKNASHAYDYHTANMGKFFPHNNLLRPPDFLAKPKDDF